MGPKKGKDTNDENYWRTLIEEAPLDDDNWKVKVIIMEAAGSDQDRLYLNKFEVFAAEERRFVIKNICKTETIFMVNQLGGEKKVKDENLRVFEEGQAYLKEKRDIPPDILALIIKKLILKMKDEYLFIKRQRLEVREGMKRESTTMINRAEVRGTVIVKPPEPAEPPPEPAKGKGKKGEPELPELPELDEGKKYNTLLRVRGEEWRDKVYLDDFPTDGPNIYVAVTGFVEPHLAESLIKIGIPLRAIVQIRINPTAVKVPSSLFRATKRGQSQTEVLIEKSLKFWDDLQQLRIQPESGDYFKSTAFLIYSPPYWDAESLSGEPEKIYDELCFLMYDIQDLTRQHLHYLDNMDIINVPDDDKDKRFENSYFQQIDDIPLESTTIYTILDNVLKTVCRSERFDEDTSQTSLSTALTLNQPHDNSKEDTKAKRAENFVSDVFKVLCNSDAKNKSYRITYGEEYETHKNPVVINFGDIVKYDTFHLGNINLDNLVRCMLYGMPTNRLWQYHDYPSGELEAKIQFHVNVLLSCFERNDVETAELIRLLHILACRKLFNNRSSLKKMHIPLSTISEFKKVYLKRSILAEPLLTCPSFYRECSSTTPSFPSMIKSTEGNLKTNISDDEMYRIKFLFECPDISELVSAAEIANQKPINHIIDDFEYFEDFTGTSAFQMMSDAFNKFNCVDYKYCEVTDCFIMMFFNSHDPDGISRDEWRCHLPTPLCLQDFFDFVLEEQYEWIKKEELIYDERMALKSQSELKVSNGDMAMQSCVDNTEVQLELLMEGSLKHKDLLEAEEATPEESAVAASVSKKTTKTPSESDIESKSSKKTKSPIVSTPKHLRKSFHTESTLLQDMPKKPFSGYDLGDRRVEVFGKDSIFFSKDGTRVSTAYSLIIPKNVENISLKIVPGNGCNEFWMHKVLGDSISSDIIDGCESFRIVSKDNVIIYVKKQHYELPLPTVAVSLMETHKPRESTVKSPNVSSKLSATVPQFFETRSFYSLIVTWPNGQITETVHENNSHDISYIKQHYLTQLPHLNEENRCVSLNGEVVVFNARGNIEVLRPDGSYINITKCGKQPVYTDIDELLSETSSDKSKKAKDKGKEKGKPSKVSSKSSKNVIMDDDHMDTKPLEYELIIEEFDTIDTDGVKEKWINDKSYFIEKLLIRTATDYCLGEVFSRRMDGTNILLNKDGVQIVTFPNNTRIITEYFIEDDVYPEWNEEELEYFAMIDSDSAEMETLKSKASDSQKSYNVDQESSSYVSGMSKKIEEEEKRNQKERSDGYVSVQLMFTIEHPNFTTITINKLNGKVTIDSPNSTSISLCKNNNCEFLLDNVTTADFNGEYLNINHEACVHCHCKTTCTAKIKSEDMCSVSQIHRNWLKMEDSFCKKVVVNDEGNINICNDASSEEIIPGEETSQLEGSANNIEKKVPPIKSESSMLSHGKCKQMYETKNMRFFVLKRDLTCSELVHRSIIEDYKQACRWQPWCSINRYNTFGDSRSIVSILSPVHRTETEKWLMESKLANKPKFLTYKDLKKDSGKGFYHWMRPYGRFEPKPKKPDNVLPDRLPRAYIFRVLEQQWNENTREQFKGGKELLRAILRYRQVIETDSESILNIPIMDLRPEDERRTDSIIQAIAHRTYEDLKMRLVEDVQSRAKATVTTKPVPPPDEISIEGELEDEETAEFKTSTGEESSVLQEVEAVEQMSPNLKRYWRRRGEEFKEEQFYKLVSSDFRFGIMIRKHSQEIAWLRYLLREGSVPPYFRNVLGGAIWWDMNNAAGEAATTAERRKMKCVCPGEEVATEATPFM